MRGTRYDHFEVIVIFISAGTCLFLVMDDELRNRIGQETCQRKDTIGGLLKLSLVSSQSVGVVRIHVNSDVHTRTPEKILKHSTFLLAHAIQLRR